MALGLNKIVLASASTNTPGAYWQLTTLTGNNSTTVVPAGTYLLFPTANVTIEAVSAYNTLIPLVQRHRLGQLFLPIILAVC